jgi:hypothetical protein
MDNNPLRRRGVLLGPNTQMKQGTAAIRALPWFTNLHNFELELEGSLAVLAIDKSTTEQNFLPSKEIRSMKPN